MSVSANSLNVAAITAALKDCPIGHTIDYRPQVTSTMVIARQHAADPTLPSGTIIVADEQTAGRGRGDRRWQVPAGAGLLLSLILKAPLPIALPQIPMAAGLAAVAAIKAHQPALAGNVGLKWPNDLLLGSGMHDACKVGGILIENSFYGTTLACVIVGMGINVFQQPDVLPAAPPGAPAPTSLAHFLATRSRAAGLPDTGDTLDRTALLIALCRAWAAELAPMPACPDALVRWRAALWTLGQDVRVQRNATNQTTATHNAVTAEPVLAVEGKAVDVTADGELIVRDMAGNLHQFTAGDVSVRMP